DLRASSDSALLRLGFNFVFLTLTSLFVAVLLGRSFLLRGTPGLLLLGCGLLLYAAAGTVGVMVGRSDPNLNIAIHNLTLLLSSACQLGGAILSLRPGPSLRAPGVWLATAYTVCGLAVVVIVQATIGGQTPVFFIPGQGGTPTRQAILAGSIGLL